MTMHTETLVYHDGETRLEAFVARDPVRSGPRPVVLVGHAWGGRDDFACAKALSLAELGYVGFALDMYGQGVHASETEQCAALMAPFVEDRSLLQRRMRLALAAARGIDAVDPSRAAAIGFCFGGMCALDLARSGADVRGVISFHGLLTPPDNLDGQSISSKVLVLHGYDDPMARPEAMTALAEELSAAGADWQIHAYGNTVHAFTNPMAQDAAFGTVYSATADHRSWRAAREFLAEVLA
jgi:dienelactone hydrolase